MTTCIAGPNGQTYFLTNGQISRTPPRGVIPTCFLPYPIIPAPQAPYYMASEPEVVDVPGYQASKTIRPPIPTPTPVPTPGAVIVAPTPGITPTCDLNELKRQRDEIKALQDQVQLLRGDRSRLSACYEGKSPWECYAQLNEVSPGIVPTSAQTPITPVSTTPIGIPPPSLFPARPVPSQTYTVPQAPPLAPSISRAPSSVPQAPPLAPITSRAPSGVPQVPPIVEVSTGPVPEAPPLEAPFEAPPAPVIAPGTTAPPSGLSLAQQLQARADPLDRHVLRIKCMIPLVEDVLLNLNVQMVAVQGEDYVYPHLLPEVEDLVEF